ncbi:MAG: DUF4040 domain-containing protein [Chloroflexi bacterium]|nr:DUF4040 domain-containing protein [Chloroflexota bacterium]MDL1884292.1 DUF4040 domain-containing protein [Anaerolineae bacterium CFX8]
MEFVPVIVVPFVLALAIVPASQRLRPEHQGWGLAAVLAILFGWLLALLPTIGEQGAVSAAISWMPQIGLNLSLYADGLSVLFALVITGIGAAVMLYAGYYFEDARQVGRFFALLLAFTGSMLAVVMAGNLLTLFIAWELTSIVSFLLISFKGSDADARAGALQALIITGGGGLALLVGLLLAGTAAGTMELSDLLAKSDVLRSHPWYGAIAVLILAGSFSKSAQFPLHFWLPGAMAAPTPASAFLHSATMVKAGVYLLARLSPILGDTPLWNTVLPVVGLLTMLIGAAVALRQRDLKGILAYTTISQLGALVALIGLPEAAGIKAAMVGILAHALYKGALFLIVGAVDHATGTRNIDELGGLWRKMPALAGVTVVAGLSMAGVPPLFGFVAKETLLEAVIAEPLALAVVVLSATLTVAVAFRLIWDIFGGKSRARLPQEEHREHDSHHPYGDDAYDYSHIHTLPGPMTAAPGLLAGLSLIAGIGIGALVTPVVSLAIGKTVSLYLLPPDGINQAFVLSIAALAAGAAIFATRRVWLSWNLPGLPGGEQIYQYLVSRVEQIGDVLLRSQGGKIRYYLAAILLTVVALLSTAITRTTIIYPAEMMAGVASAADILEIVLLVLALVATLASILLERHLLAAMALGVAGYSIGGIFLLEPAPDVALVQFLIETLATVLIIIILARTSEEERRRAITRLWGQTNTGLKRDVLISVTLGVAVGFFALAAVNSRPTPNTIAAWHLENALPQVGVKDVVAGIITDFRGTDTLIEITVFGMAALGVLTMLARPNPGKTWSLFRRPETSESPIKDALQEDAERPEPVVYRSHFADPVTQLAAGLVLPFAMLIGLAHLLYAGAAPGDGFTAGVIGGLGVALWFVVYGYEETKRRLRWLHPGPLIGIGLTLAFANAILPLIFGREFLAFTPIDGFSLADIKLASTVLFEVGICLTVFGGVSAILEAISHPMEVEPL